MLRRITIVAAVIVFVSAALCLAGGAVLCEGALRVPRHAPPANPLSLLSAADAVSIAAWRAPSVTARDGAKLHAWLLKAKAPNGDAVLILHGIADSRTGGLGLALLFLKNHYDVLLPDSRAHGSSGGELVTYGLLEADDVKRWAEWLKTAEHPKNIYGLGESLGAAVLLQSLPLSPGIRAVVAECSYASFQRIAEYRVAERIPLPEPIPSLLAKPLVWSGFFYARWKYSLDLRAASPEADIEKPTVPILLIHGLNDHRTPPENSKILATRPLTDLWLVPGAEHTGAYGTAPEEFSRRVLNWFRSNARS